LNRFQALSVTAAASLATAMAVWVPSASGTVDGVTVFADVNTPIGVAVTSTRVLTALFISDKIKQIDSNGTVSNFADLPTTGRFVERYLAISPGLAGFPKGYIYATVGQNVYQITPDGRTVTLCVNIPSMPNGETGITFDTVGTFGHKMILTDRRGPVWTVDSCTAPVVEQIGDFGLQIEGPLVVPVSLGRFGGWLWGGNEFQDGVYAMSKRGVVRLVVHSESPESLVLIPSTVCNFGTSGGAYFIALKDQKQVMMYRAADFNGLGGDVLAPAELDATIARIHWDGSSYRVFPFSNGSIGAPDLEGSAFAPCGPRQR
jgi:hypothetical protein